MRKRDPAEVEPYLPPGSAIASRCERCGVGSSHLVDNQAKVLKLRLTALLNLAVSEECGIGLVRSFEIVRLFCPDFQQHVWTENWCRYAAPNPDRRVSLRQAQTALSAFDP